MHTFPITDPFLNTAKITRKRSPFSKAATKCELTQRSHMASLHTFRVIVIAAEREKATKILLRQGSPGASFHRSMKG